MSKTYDEMNKRELRAEMKRQRIVYGSLTVSQMRAALLKKAAGGANVDTEAGSVVTKASDTTEAKRGAISAANGRGVARVATSAKREQRNGVVAPVRGVCRDVWDYMSKHPGITIADAKAVAPKRKWNINNLVIEFYRHRRFHGKSA